MKPMKNPLGVSPSKGYQGTTRGKNFFFTSCGSLIYLILCTSWQTDMPYCALKGFYFLISLLPYLQLKLVKANLQMKKKQYQTVNKRSALPSRCFTGFVVQRSTAKHHGKRFLNARILYTANGTSSFQFDRITLSGDVQSFIFFEVV